MDQKHIKRITQEGSFLDPKKVMNVRMGNKRIKLPPKEAAIMAKYCKGDEPKILHESRLLDETFVRPEKNDDKTKPKTLVRRFVNKVQGK